MRIKTKWNQPGTDDTTLMIPYLAMKVLLTGKHRATKADVVVPIVRVVVVPIRRLQVRRIVVPIAAPFHTIRASRSSP
jgi:hypothetical protein